MSTLEERINAAKKNGGKRKKGASSLEDRISAAKNGAYAKQEPASGPVGAIKPMVQNHALEPLVPSYAMKPTADPLMPGKNGILGNTGTSSLDLPMGFVTTGEAKAKGESRRLETEDQEYYAAAREHRAAERGIKAQNGTAAKAEQAVKQAEKDIEDVVKKYGGVRTGGGITFPTQQGVDAYNAAIAGYAAAASGYNAAVEGYGKAADRMTESGYRMDDLWTEHALKKIEGVSGKAGEELKRLRAINNDIGYKVNNLGANGDEVIQEEYAAEGFKTWSDLLRRIKELENTQGQAAKGYYETSGEGAVYRITRGGENEALDKAAQLLFQAEEMLAAHRYGGWDQKASRSLTDLYNQIEPLKKQLIAAGFSEEDVNAALEYMVYAQRNEAAAKRAEEIKRAAEEHPGWESVKAIAAAPLQGWDFLNMRASTAGRNDATDLKNYKPASTADMQTTQYVSTVTGTVADKIRGEDPNLLNKAAAFLYQTGMSMGQSIAQVAAFGPASVAIMGASAASSAAYDVIERGGTNNQAFWSGIAAGAAEMIFEKFSVESLLEGVGDSGFWRSVLKQAGIEASEEMATEIANILSDAAIMGHNSKFNTAVREYMTEEGISEEEAKQKAFLDCVADVGLAGLGGALSGGGSMMLRGGGQMAVSKAVDNARENEFMRRHKAAEQAFAEIEGQKETASGMETVEQDGKPSSVGAEGAATFHQGKAMEESAKPAEAGAQPAQVGGERVQAGMDTPEQGTKQKAVEWAKPKAAGVYDTRTKSDAEPLNRVLSDRNVLYLKAVSRATGLRINIVDASENADGWYENGEIFIAENCKDPVNWIATHEVTHHLEQAAPEAYARYLEKVKNYLSEKEVLQKDIDKVRSVYAEREVALTEDSALREVAANFTERLMLDENLFNRVAREDRSLAQRILDSLKEFIRRIRTTWSGQEIRQLEATRKAWEKALRESRGKTVEGGERQYAIRYDRSNTPYVVVEENILDGVPENQWVEKVKEVLKKRFPNGVRVGSNVVKINSQTRREMTFSEYTKWLAKNDKSTYADKFRAANYADEILLASRDYINEGLKHERKDNIRDFARGTVQIRVGESGYAADVIVGTTASGEMLLYDIVNMRSAEIAEKSRSTVQPNLSESRRSGTPASKDSILNSAEKSNNEFSGRQNALRGLSDAIAEAEQGDKLAQGNALRREKTRLSDVEHQKKLLEDGGMSALKENEKKIKALEHRLQKLEGTMQPKTLDRKGQASTGARYLPTTAKRDLRRNLLDMFSVKDGVRAVAGKYIDWVADRMLNSGSLSDKDRNDLFNYLYGTGMVENTATDAELDTMEREVEWALRTFAEKARLEISLRKRAGTALKEERAARRKSLERQREFKNLQELQQKTLKQLQWLSKNRQRASQDLKAAFDEVLGNIDTFAVGAANDMNWSKKHQATWRDLAQMYKAAKENDPNFLPSKELDRIVTRLDGDKIADMDVDALMELYRAAVGIRTEFYNRNNVINDEMNRMLAEIYTDSVREISSAAGRFTGKWADKLVNLQQLTPMNVLERMAGWNRDGAFYSMARQLERGERDMRDYTVKANAMLEEFLTEHADWVKRADGQGKDAIWYEIEVPELLELGMGDKPIFGETRKVYMTPSQKVHMYLESKNYANLLHMVGGRTFANRELYSKGKRGEAFAQGTTIRLAPETVKKLVSDLTEEEMELARLLERYYDEFASGRINRTSNALHGFDKAVTRNYAPIFTNKNYVQGEIGVFDMTAEGVGVMRGRQQYAKNPSYQIGCFDAFERHVDQTARYVGMAIPARNWNALLNWREKNNSTWDVITHKWGKESKEYIEDLLKRLQGGKGEKGDIVSAGAGKLMSNYISSIFGVNPSIVFKQIGSFFMAMPELGIENIPKPAQLKVDKKLIGKYTSELAWRGMGYATPETKQLKENPTKLQTNKVVRFLTGGAITAMDQATASALWPWAENKVRKEFPELEVGTPEQIDAGESPFYKKVAAEFNDAVNRSQSVSDEIHQSSLKKSKNPVTKTLTMFKSDSAQGYNQLRQRIGEARYYEKSGADEETVRKARLAAGEAVLGILANNAWAAVVSFLIALWKNKGKKYRDDEEELTARSVMLEMAGNIFDGMAGLVIGGEELAEALGSIVTGDRWYGFDAPGIAQVEDLVELVINSGQGAIEFAKGAANVLGNDGDFGKYLKDHSNEIVGGIKELAQAAAQYFGGLPVGNLEAYLLGGVKWALPGVATAYEDALQRVEKNTLSGLSGKALEQRMGTLMKRRIGEVEKNTVKAMSALYESGHKGAAPTSAPDSVTVKGVEKTLNEAEKQFFDKAWSAAVVGVIDEIAASEEFLTADKKTQEDMLEKLYGYAREKAKAAILEEYELAKWVQEADGDVKAGESLSKWIVWEVLSSDVSSDFDKLTGAGLPNQRALEIAEELDELEPEAGKEDVSAMQRYGAIFSLPLSASDLDKAVKAVMSDSAYGKYKTARDAGVSADTYWWFLKRTSGISGDGKKEKILSFINSLKLSDKQKDTLFLAAGYKESGLPDAPWN